MVISRPSVYTLPSPPIRQLSVLVAVRGVTPSQSVLVTVELLRGDGTFPAASLLASPGASRRFLASDVDGPLLISASNPDSPAVRIYRHVDLQQDMSVYLDLIDNHPPAPGNGYLAGTFPLNMITQGGNLPSHAEIRILYRPESGDSGDGVVVATTACNVDGSWQVTGLDENLKFDVVARIPGFNDVIISDVQPTGSPLAAHFAGIKEEYEYEDEVSIQVVALGGKPPYVFEAVSLPDGLTFDSDTGYITGFMPAGDLMISITVTDEMNDSVTITWEGTVVRLLPTVIGEPWGGGFYVGDIEYPDGQWYKLIVASIEADVYGLLWKTENTNTPGTDSLTDGWANTRSMNSDAHPAAAHCLDYRGGGHDDWSMPAKDELNLFWLNIAPNKTQAPDFMTGGPQALNTSQNYWSSTQYSSYPTDAWVQRFSDGNQSTGSKNGALRRLRPVRRIPFFP